MLPIVLNAHAMRIGLAGLGQGLARRQALLEQAGAQPAAIPPDADEKALAGLHLLFVAGLDSEPAGRLAALARRLDILVNVEDVPKLCDFHVPAMVRRGDLLLTASTGGRVPGLSRQVREWLETRFGPEWEDRLRRLSVDRASWRQQGLPMNEVSARTREFVAKEGWL